MSIFYLELWSILLSSVAVSEAIALKIRRPGSPREYLYAQIFAGSSYIIASVCMYKLRAVTRTFLMLLIL